MGARCHAGWPGTRPGSKFSGPWHVAQCKPIAPKPPYFAHHERLVGVAVVALPGTITRGVAVYAPAGPLLYRLLNWRR